VFLKSSQIPKKWDDWLTIIHSDIEESLYLRHIFYEVLHIIETNPKIPNPRGFKKWMGSLYTQAMVIRVRRHSEVRDDSTSFARLLTEILDNPQILNIRPGEVCHDLCDLKDKTKAIGKFASKKVAHMDSRSLSHLPTYDQLNECLNFLENLLKRYLKHFGKAVPDPLVRVTGGAWKNCFLVPWIERTSRNKPPFSGHSTS
jgi:hypothetical protein